MRVWIDRAALAARGLTMGDIETALRARSADPAGGAAGIERARLHPALDRSFSRRPPTSRDCRSAAAATATWCNWARWRRWNSVPPSARVLPHQRPSAGRAGHRQDLHRQRPRRRRGRAQEIERINRTLPNGMKLAVTYDATVFIDVAVHEVYKTLAEAIVLVLVVIWLFLGSLRSALVPAVTVPVCVTAAFLPLLVFGFSINLLTLLALVLSIGLVVDDAIVVLENIQRRADLGRPAPLAALRGTQVAFRGASPRPRCWSRCSAHRLPRGQQRPPVPRTRGGAGRRGRDFRVLVALTLTPMMARCWCIRTGAPRTGHGVSAGWRRSPRSRVATATRSTATSTRRLFGRDDAGCASRWRSRCSRRCRANWRRPRNRGSFSVSVTGRKAPATESPSQARCGRWNVADAHGRGPSRCSACYPRAGRYRRPNMNSGRRSSSSSPGTTQPEHRRGGRRVRHDRRDSRRARGAAGPHRAHRSNGQPFQVVLQGPEYAATRAMARCRAGEDGPESRPSASTPTTKKPAADAGDRRPGRAADLGVTGGAIGDT